MGVILAPEEKREEKTPILPDHTQLPVPEEVWEEKFPTLPDHTQLPETDGSIVHNFQEHPQSMLLTDSITPVLRQLHPDGQYCLGQDCGIYWKSTDPPLEGCKAPDWFYVPGRPPLVNGAIRRSYTLWYEGIAPRLLIEYVSGDGSEERDRTPEQGKFWVYEQGIRAPYYVIYEVNPGRVEAYQLQGWHYVRLEPNERGHIPIEPLGVELGIWKGQYQNQELPWLRWWDANGNLLLTSDERAERERQRAEQEQQRAETAEQRAETAEQRAETAEQRAQKLADRLRELGVDPDQV